MVRRLLWGLLAALALPAGGRADPDPVALLRAVQAAREPLHGTLALRLVVTGVKPRPSERTVRLEVEFDGPRRRFTGTEPILTLDSGRPGRPDEWKRYQAGDRDPQKAAAAGVGKMEAVRTRVVYDGDQLADYAPGGGATIRRTTEEPSDITYDPRLLGLAASLGHLATCESVLGYQPPNTVTLAGREELDGVPVWRVSVARPRGRTTDF